MALYLATCPHQNLVGIYRLPIAYVEADTGLSPKAVESAFRDLEDTGYVRRDAARDIVWVVEHARHELGDKASKPQSVAVSKVMDEFAGSEIVAEFAEKYPQYLPDDYPVDSLSIATRPPEQEPEQEQRESSTLRSEDSCSEPAGADSEPKAVMTFPTRGEAEAWDLTEPLLSEMQELYEGIDVRSECKRALAWVKANPIRRKTPRGMRTFLNGWINRSVNRGNAALLKAGTRSPAAPPRSDPRTDADLLLQEAWKRAQERKDLDADELTAVSEALQQALDQDNPVDAVKAVRSEHGI